MDIEKYNPDLKIQRDRLLEQLRNYEFYKYKERESYDELRMRDFKFLFEFLPDQVQSHLMKYTKQIGLDDFIRYAIRRVEELAGESSMDNTIETKLIADGAHFPDFSQVEFYKSLLVKIREFERIYELNK